MNIFAKNRTKIIAIFISLLLMVTSIIGIIFIPRINNVKADEYNYGEFNEKGYYMLNGVTFYGIKIKLWEEEKQSYNIYKTFDIEGITFTYDLNSKVVRYEQAGQNQTIQVNNNQFVYNGKTYTLNDNNVTFETSSIPYTQKYFNIGAQKYIINADEVVKDGGADDEKYLITKNEFAIGDVSYAICESQIKVVPNGLTVEGEQSSYWPQYTPVTDEKGNIVFIKFGETVLLKEDEAILINFARQTDDGSGFVVDENGQIISSGVDFLNANVFVDGVNENNALPSQVKVEGGSASYIKEFGYIIDPNEIVPSSIYNGEKIYHAKGLGVNSGREGMVEFSTSEYEINNILESYSFMFYVFKYDTYNRTEELNPNAPDSIKERPNTVVNATNYVTDPKTQEQYFSESFYFYENQNLPYLEFNPLRYEILITKTIHRNSVDYNFVVNNQATDGQITNPNENKKYTTIVDEVNGLKIAQTISQTLSTMDIYARGLRVEACENGNIRIYFEDLGEYTISYKAVYYKGGVKTVLENLNKDLRTDKLTIFGTEATYQDYTKGQTPFRNESNTIYADLTGIIALDNIFNSDKSLNYSGIIASTNQPPIKFLFNTPVNTTQVYYSVDNTKYEKTTNYQYTSNFEKPGYYVVVLDSSYEGYKTWLTSSNTARVETKTISQIFVFQVKEQTPKLEVYVLGDNGEVAPEGDRQRVYTDSFVKNGVQIIEFEKANEFDSQIYFELTKKGYGQSSSQAITIKLPNEDYDKLSQEQIAELASYGITKHDGYYILKPTEGVSVDAEYQLALKFGNSGKETITFKLDTQPITGMSTYTAESVYGTNYFKTNLVSGQGQLALTNSAFTVFWNNKASGAKINATFVRFAINQIKYNDVANNYILNSTWVASDYSIVLANNNPETRFERANSVSTVETQSVLSFSGLYIFRLEDEAGNVAYYSVLLDTATPTILQKNMNSGEEYKIINGVNNVVEATTLFFGSHKAISFRYQNQLTTLENLENTLFTGESANNASVVYLKEFFNNLGNIDSLNRVSTDQANNNLFVSVPIVSIFERTSQGNPVKLDSSIISQGYYNRLAPLGEDGRLLDVEFFYQIFDASNQSGNRIPTRTYSVRFNTDRTGLLIFTDKNDVNSKLPLVVSETADDYAYRINYYSPTTKNIVYFTWQSLFPEELGVFVDVENDGLICEFYPLIYDKEKNTYVYSETPILVDLGLDRFSDEELSGNGYDENGIKIAIELNVVNGQTLPGKYVLTRKYSAIGGGEIGNIGNDFETLKTVFFVDRAPIISSNNSQDERNGFYTFITTFDGTDYDEKEFFNELYRQSQSSLNYILQTNQLPIGFYIPVSKYGTVYEVKDGVLGVQALSLEDVQKAQLNFKFVDLIVFNNIDINEFSPNSTYSPFELTVTLMSPLKNENGENVYYYYSYSSENGYFMLSGYSYGELGIGEQPTEIKDKSYFIKNNPISGDATYATGNYILKIGCVNDILTNQFNQQFNVVINVVGDGPIYDMTAKYPELDNVEDREIEGVEIDGNVVYFTNTNEIVFHWQDFKNSFITPIDVSRISFKYYIGAKSVTVPNRLLNEKILVHDVNSGEYYTFDEQGNKEIVLEADINNPIYVIKVEKNNNDYSFSAKFDENATKFTIEMAFEVYSTDTGRAHTIYYPNGNYRVTRTINIDRNAPTSSISNLKNNDKTVENIVDSLLRESDDTRYSKSSTSGMFKYYTFIVDSNYFEILSASLATNNPTETKTFYFRSFNNKYNGAAYQETGLGYDKSSRGDNLFSEYFAVSSGWTKVTDKISGNIFKGYYEVVEVDIAGNMTIYSVYIGDNRKVELDLTKFTGNIENGNVSITKSTEENPTIDAIVKFNGPSMFYKDIIKTPLEIDSYDYLTINYIYLGFAQGDNSYDFYRYLKFNVDGKDYYLTSDNFVNVGTNEQPKIACKTAYNSVGEKVNISDIQLNGQSTTHIITFVDTVNKISDSASTYSVKAMVASLDDRLTDNGGSIVQSDVIITDDTQNIISNSNLTLILTRPINPSLNIDESTLRFFKISSNGETYTTYKLDDKTLSKFQKTTNLTTTTYYYIPSELDFYQSTFFVVYKDNFGNEYRHLVEYKESDYNRYEGEFDITEESQSKTEILASGTVAVNISNLFSVSITDLNGKNVAGNLKIIESEYLGGSYTQYQLLPITTSKDGYYGGKIDFKLVLTYNIPEGIYNELNGLFDFVNSGDGAVETLYVTIYNQLPEIKVTDPNGKDITDSLFNKEINQSEPITLSFNSGNSLSEQMGYMPKVFLRLRGSEQGFIEITSPYVVSQPGIYDLYIQNFDEEGNALDFVIKKDFIISDLDVMFYSVVKTNSNGEEIVVSPTGKAFEYTTGSFASYHYIINTNNWEVITNGRSVNKTQIYKQGNTTVYEIVSNAGTIYKAVIAITVVNETNDLFGANPFIWYLGTNYYIPNEENYINSINKDIFLCKEDNENQITLRWASYYSIPENKIICYASGDDGKTWNVVNGDNNGTVTTLTLNKSVSLMFKFEDLAGNIQYFASSSGFPSQTTKVNFIRSVIINVNGGNQIDNAIYNNNVIINIPANTTRFYSTKPVINVLRNNQPYTISPDASGNYVFTETGVYQVYFSAKVEQGKKNLNEDVLVFTIINPNDSRWAFNYVNYNKYNIKSIKYNGQEISKTLLEHALMVPNEINFSAFDSDSLGNKWFNNGTYTITLSYIDDALGEQDFEFSFWLNDSKPPINISLGENESTKGNVTVEYNKANIYETLGDCYIKVDNQVICEIDLTTIGQADEPYTIAGHGVHYVQIYTKSGKLVYSQQVKIDKPLDTMTIIIIVVSVVVVAVGILIFVLLRKKMQVR